MSAIPLPRALRPSVLVCGTAHPRLGPPCWLLAAPLDSVAPLALPRCGWRRCCNPDHVDPALFTTRRTSPAAEGVQA